ncbi:MAG: rhodanese-like domain-containing protein [Clostridia bacterium]|nr:rhodanese-like domain-containing protein [Clostridia bacterium]
MFQKIKKVFYRSVMDNDINYEVAKKILRQENGALIDVRSKQEFEEGHLPTAIHVSLYDIQKQIEKIIPDKSKLIVVCCSSGNRSQKAKQILENMGYQEVYNLKGGLNAIF